MSAVVTKAFIDKLTGAYCLKGEVLELTDARFDELSKGGFVKPVSKPKTKQKIIKED